jgi:hypothetical protein
MFLHLEVAPAAHGPDVLAAKAVITLLDVFLLALLRDPVGHQLQQTAGLGLVMTPTLKFLKFTIFEYNLLWRSYGEEIIRQEYADLKHHKQDEEQLSLDFDDQIPF